MLSGVQWEGYGGHEYGVREGKLCVLDIDMELSYVMLGKVLCRYVDRICGVCSVYLF
jgi:hypothetical protein